MTNQAQIEAELALKALENAADDLERVASDLNPNDRLSGLTKVIVQLTSMTRTQKTGAAA